MRATTVGTLVLGLALGSGCGNVVDAGPPTGLLGISVTSEGHYVLQSFVCRDKIGSVDIFGDREGLDESEENPLIRSYRASRPLTGLLTLDLSAPGEEWTPAEVTRFEVGRGYIVSGQGSEGYDNSTTQLNVDPDELAAMEPGRVYVSEDNLTSVLTGHRPEEFIEKSRDACQLDAS